MSEIVMVIDDSEQNLVLLECILTEKGYWVLTANCAENALARMVEIRPDLILMDIMMPGIDGFELCKRLKQQEQTAEIPVIFLSGMNSPHDKVHGLELGVVKQKELDRDLRAAAQIQQTLVPRTAPEVPGLTWPVEASTTPVTDDPLKVKSDQ